MTKDLLKDIADYLIIYASDVVTQNGIDIFRDGMPDQPNNCVSLNEYEGQPSFINNDVLRSIQVRVRNMVFETARTSIWKIFTLLYDPEHDKRFIQINQTRWIQVSPRSTPYKLIKDETGREIFIFNMGVLTNRDS